MIDFHTYQQIHYLFKEKKLNRKQIAEALGINVDTVSTWLKKERYDFSKPRSPRKSKLDPYKKQILSWLEEHPFSAVQIYQKLQEAGFEGRLTIVKDYVARVRPKPRPAYLKLHFEPGDCAQVDWGECGLVPVKTSGGATIRRRLYVFVMVLCYSRLMFLRFSLSQSMEHFLENHVKAFEFFGSIPRRVMIDNLKTGVLEHKRGLAPVFNPRYLELAGHYGFHPVACNVGAGHEKGRVENGVGYVKKNFLSGRQIEDFTHLEVAADHWRDTVANLRVHGTTQRVPAEVFETEEKDRLLPLHPHRYDCAVCHQARVSKDGRVLFDTNTYSVPPGYGRQLLQLRAYPEKILIYAPGRGLIATHQRCYGRKQDIEQSEHVQALKNQRRRAREQNLLNDFQKLFGTTGSAYYQQLQERVLDARDHLRKILALAEIYGVQKVQRALQDGLELGAFRSDYIAHVLEAQSRASMPEPGPLHLTRNEDQLEVQLPEPDLSCYDPEQPSNPEQAPEQTPEPDAASDSTETPPNT